MKVICSSLAALPSPLPIGARAFTFFEPSSMPTVGRIAHGWPRELEHAGYAPPVAVWDFVLLAFAVCAADFVVPRKGSPDGWTREIELVVTLNNPAPWDAQRTEVESMLRVLTGDFWTLSFLAEGPRPPAGERVLCDRDCVALLSGGLDSLVGGIDAQAVGRRPIFVSQLAYEDSERQRAYALALGGGQWHQQWSHRIVFEGRQEPSTRARSLAFYGLAVLASSLLEAARPAIVVPENGFISLNPPLLPGRMASLSTRTTHPQFMQMLQDVLDSAGVNVQLEMPYRFKTKGEMLVECQDQTLLSQFAADTTSCGRYRTYNRMHCGRCVPCMVRKAAFIRWNPTLDTTRYKFARLTGAAKSSADDPMAVACAALAVESKGVDAFLGATLAFASAADRPNYRHVVDQGIAELRALLLRDGVL
jgi:hypothetical protein